LDWIENPMMKKSNSPNPIRPAKQLILQNNRSMRTSRALVSWGRWWANSNPRFEQHEKAIGPTKLSVLEKKTIQTILHLSLVEWEGSAWLLLRTLHNYSDFLCFFFHQHVPTLATVTVLCLPWPWLDLLRLQPRFKLKGAYLLFQD
jgi:hypothetical protein